MLIREVEGLSILVLIFIIFIFDAVIALHSYRGLTLKPATSPQNFRLATATVTTLK